MKKSQMFRMAQLAVLKDTDLFPGDKLEILKVLSSEEDIQKLVEKREEQQTKKESEVEPY